MGQPQRSLRVAIYCRISQDRDGEGLGVERQEQDCRARAEREGWSVTDVYTDNDISASTSSTKARPAYKAMIEAAERGEVDVILSYSNSRLTRRPLELEHLITLHNRTGVLLRTIVSGDANLAEADGRAVARTIAAWDAADAERQSERTKRALRQRREAGLRIGGRAPLGYRYASKGLLEIDPPQAEVIKEAAKRFLAGESAYGIINDFNSRGLRTGTSARAPQGARWQLRTFNRVLTTPAVIGCLELPDGTLREVAAPILSREDHARLCEMLSGRKSQPDWTNRRRYVLSGLIVCGECGHVMTGSTRRRYADGGKIQTFQCSGGNGGCDKLRIDYQPVEDWVVSQVLYRLDVPGIADALTEPAPDVSSEVEPLRAQIDDDKRALERLEDEYDDGDLSRDRYNRRSARITARIDEARQKLAELQQATFTVDTGGKTLREVWEDHSDDVAWRRTFLENVITAVTIAPHPTGVGNVHPRRKGDTDESLAQRRREHRESMLEQRVRVTWR